MTDRNAARRRVFEWHAAFVSRRRWSLAHRYIIGRPRRWPVRCQGFDVEAWLVRHPGATQLLGVALGQFAAASQPRPRRVAPARRAMRAEDKR